MTKYINLIKPIFYPNPIQALDESIRLAEALGFPQNEILTFLRR